MHLFAGRLQNELQVLYDRETRLLCQPDRPADYQSDSLLAGTGQTDECRHDGNGRTARQSGRGVEGIGHTDRVLWLCMESETDYRFNCRVAKRTATLYRRKRLSPCHQPAFSGDRPACGTDAGRESLFYHGNGGTVKKL